VPPAPLPLASAAERIRKPPGRSRSLPLADQAAAAVTTSARRLLDVRGVAAYLSVSVRIVHELRAAGHLKPITLPLADGRALGKLLFEKSDVDKFVDANKAEQ
jgi:hypothetical protein